MYECGSTAQMYMHLGALARAKAIGDTVYFSQRPQVHGFFELKLTAPKRQPVQFASPPVPFAGVTTIPPQEPTQVPTPPPPANDQSCCYTATLD